MNNCDSSCRVHTYLGAVTRVKNEYPRDAMSNTIEHTFENGHFPIPAGWDVYLKTAYGDYMSLPPIEKRRNALHALFFDLNKDYTEYFNQ